MEEHTTELREADIRETDIRETDIQETDIRETDIRETDIREARRRFSRLGWGAFLTLAVGSLLQVAAGGILTKLSPGWNETWLLWVVTFAPLYLVSFPLGVFIMRTVPAYPPAECAPAPGAALKAVPISLCVMYLGNLAGIGVLYLLNAVTGTSASNPVMQYVADESAPVLKILALSVLAPIAEEYLFRKTIIDRARVYGDRLALITSALMFGLFHGNLSQFFYAFGLGLVFGYVYLKTGQFRYSAALHVLINLLGGVIAPWMVEQAGMDLAGNAAPTAESITPGAVLFLLYSLLMAVLFLAGLFLLGRALRRIQFDPAAEELPKDRRFSTVWCNPGMAFMALGCLALFAVSLLL